MKKQLKKLTIFLQENKEDFKYLFMVGLPSGIFLILLSQCANLCEVY